MKNDHFMLRRLAARMAFDQGYISLEQYEAVLNKIDKLEKEYAEANELYEKQLKSELLKHITA